MLRGRSIGVLLLAVLGCRDTSRHFVPVAGPVDLGPEWVDLAAPAPLRAPAWRGELCLTVAPPFLLDDSSFAVRRPNGRRFVPAAVMVSAAGRADSLTDVSYLGRDQLCLGRVSSELHEPYARVRLRSSEPVSLTAVQWSSVDK